MAALPDGCADLILTDLPYGMTANAWDEVIDLSSLWKLWKRLLCPRGAVVLHGMGLFHARLILSNPRWYRYSWVWRKSNVTGFLNARKQPLRACELIAVFYPRQCTYNPQFTMGRPYRSAARLAKSDNYGICGPHVTVSDGRRYPIDILEVKSAITENGRTVHPTQKPVELERYLIRTYTNEGATVLDCCMGSGTTGVAAMLEGRKFIGIEKDDHYYATACDRISQASLH